MDVHLYNANLCSDADDMFSDAVAICLVGLWQYVHWCNDNIFSDHMCVGHNESACTMQCSTVYCSAMPWSGVQGTALNYTALNYTALNCTALNYTALNCTALCPRLLCNSVSAQPLVRRSHRQYTHLALGHGANRTELEPALGWPIELLWYSVITIVCG